MSVHVHAMHPHDMHQSFLSEINHSLADQMFAEKERLVSVPDPNQPQRGSLQAIHALD